MKKHIINFFKGIALGASIVVPGVSGGTMAIILGVYNRIIEAINGIFKFFKKHIVFLLVVGVGGIVGILALSSLIEKAIDRFPEVTNYLFIGIVLGSFPLIFKESGINFYKKETAKRRSLDFALLIIGAAVVVGISFLKAGIIDLSTSDGFLGVIANAIAGFITAVALVLPGISGSLFLKSIGLYERFITSLSISNFDIFFILPFAIGLVFGVLLTAKAMEKFLNKFKRGTFLVIIGFLAGTIVTMFMETQPYGIIILYSIIALIIGICFTLSIFFVSIKYRKPLVENEAEPSALSTAEEDIEKNQTEG